MTHHHHPGHPPHDHDHEDEPSGPTRDDGRNARLHVGEAAGRTLFVDAFSGVSGDMLVAALIDLGVPFDRVREALMGLELQGFDVSLRTVVRSGIGALRFVVDVDDEQPERSYGAIRELLGVARLSERARSIAQRSFLLLAEAEASVHRMAVEDVHFHEVGAVDSIVDIVAAAVCVDHLGARVIGSPLPMGRGTVRASHGVLPLPAPATVECLRGVPTYDAGLDAELVTPTGACVLATIAEGYARWPAIRPERVGWGGGTRELSDRPNLLRVVLGDPSSPHDQAGFAVLEANVDDQSPEQLAYATEQLLEAGALDAWTAPIGMKKGRSAVMICALTRASDADAIARCMLAETSSLGVRVRPVDRIERPRRIVEVTTVHGTVRVKIADGDGLPVHIAPEHDDCRRLALGHRTPIKRVFEDALMAARRLLGLEV